MREKREDWKDRQQESDGVIEGRNAVLEALRAGTPVDKIYIAKGRPTPPWATLPPRRGARASWWWRPTGASWTP